MKMDLDRRQFLAGSAGALSMSLIPPSLWAAAAKDAKDTVPAAPVARIEVVRDTYFGETLSDPYRWMENSKDRDWLPFLKGQNDHTRAVIDALPGRAALLKRIEQLSGESVATSRVQRAGGMVFIQQRPLGADNFKLFVRQGMNGTDRVLVDPTAMSSAKSHVSLDWWRASPDGKYVAYGLSKDGSEDSLLHVLTVADGKDLPETIPNTEGANPRWLDDGSGFFYTQLTGAVATPERYLDAQARFHKLGTGSEVRSHSHEAGFGCRGRLRQDSDSDHRHLAGFPLRDFAACRREAGSTLLHRAARRCHNGQGEMDFLRRLRRRGDRSRTRRQRFVPAGQQRLAARAHRQNLAAAAPSIANGTVVVPQNALVIENLARARDGIYLKIMDGGISRLQRLGRDGKVTDIALPFDGTIGAVFTVPNEDGALISLQGWLTPAGIWSIDGAGRPADTGITPKPPVDVSAYEARRFFAIAKDGVKIPYTLIYRKGMKQDGSNPTWISAYGSYGLPAYTPTFAGRTLALVDTGAIVGYANVRGGGEYGREWHKAGQLANKPNTWRDLIAVCEELIAKKYTSSAHLAIGGRSAGGITVGRAMTERPDLFAAVIDGVGWSNPLRYVASSRMAMARTRNGEPFPIPPATKRSRASTAINR